MNKILRENIFKYLILSIKSLKKYKNVKKIVIFSLNSYGYF